jgi:hypothetical protein
MSNDGGVNSISKCPVSIDPLPSQAGVPLLDWLSRTSEERACVVAVASLVASALSQETAQPCADCRPRSQLVASLAALERAYAVGCADAVMLRAVALELLPRRGVRPAAFAVCTAACSLGVALRWSRWRGFRRMNFPANSPGRFGCARRAWRNRLHQAAPGDSACLTRQSAGHAPDRRRLLLKPLVQPFVATGHGLHKHTENEIVGWRVQTYHRRVSPITPAPPPATRPAASSHSPRSARPRSRHRSCQCTAAVGFRLPELSLIHDLRCGKWRLRRDRRLGRDG